MRKQNIISAMIAIIVFFAVIQPISASREDLGSRVEQPLAAHVMSLENRHPVVSSNEIYRDNILLALAYQRGATKLGQAVNWGEVRMPFTYTWTVKAGKTFAFHDAILPQFGGTAEQTTNAHFGGDEGFKADEGLVGMGVCHLASLMDWVARDAELDVMAPTNHDFAMIPDVSREYGVSIYATDGSQNLYVTNNSGHDVSFTITYDGHVLTLNAARGS